ncbi:solute carrier family 22 member 3-like [Oratosquilla oratoria]|uniref:solute carrier family 22 member 3-like n=1 Tax=Oratosquilla oratoria TaxID=337810 RepID=UPI003F773424
MVAVMPFKDKTPSGGVECKKYRKYLDADTTAVSSPGAAEDKVQGDSSFEEFMSLAGNGGRWHVGFIFLVYIGGIPSAFMVLAYQFLGATPEYWCHVQELHDANWTTQQIIDFAIPRKVDGELEGCLQRDYNYSLAASLGYEAAKENLDLITNVVNGTVSCPKRDFNHTEYKSTLVTDFDLVCERRALYSTTSSVAQIGMLFASLIVGYVTDLFGKRRLVLVCYIILIMCGALLSMAPSVEMYLVIKFFESVSRMSAAITEYILVLELCSNSQRAYISSFGGIPWSVGTMLLPAIAYSIREWKYLQLVFVAPFLYTVVHYWVLPESPRWLILRGRYKEAVKVLKSIAYWNKRTLPCDEKLMEMVKSINIKDEDTEGDKEQGSGKSLVRRGLEQLQELFQSRIKTLRTLVLFFCWFTTGFVYYGISLISTNIGSNQYWYMFFGGLVEIPSSILLWPLIHFVGRRLSLIGCFVLCAASILGSLGVGESAIWKTILSLSGKFAISASFSLVYLLAAEINTTKSRTLAVGISSVVARFGSISSPYVNDLIGDTNPTAPVLMFGILSCISAVLAINLPETRKAILPESRFDVENIGSGVKMGNYESTGKTESRDTPIK